MEGDRPRQVGVGKAAAELLHALPAKDALASEEWTKRNHAFQDEMTSALSSASFDVRTAKTWRDRLILCWFHSSTVRLRSVG